METPPPPPVLPQPTFLPAMPPPVPNKDADNLRLLAIFHYVTAGLALPVLGFLALHYTMMKFMFTQIEVKHTAQPPKDVPPFNAEEFFGVFQWFYIVAGLVLLIGGIMTFISGRCIAKRTHRTFSQIVAGLSCLHFPFGMILGIFTLVVLTKESVARLYAEAEAKRA